MKKAYNDYKEGQKVQDQVRKDKESEVVHRCLTPENLDKFTMSLFEEAHRLFKLYFGPNPPPLKQREYCGMRDNLINWIIF